MTSHEYEFLLPLPDEQTQGWWDATKRHELVVQECADCTTLRHPPLATCPNCGSENKQWRTMSGFGTLYSYVIVQRATLPNWRAAVPYNIVVVELNDAPGIRLHGNVIDVENSELKVGLPLEAVFDDVTPQYTFLRWRVVERPVDVPVRTGAAPRE